MGMILLIVTVTPLDSEDVYLSLLISTVKSTAAVMRTIRPMRFEMCSFVACFGKTRPSGRMRVVRPQRRRRVTTPSTTPRQLRKGDGRCHQDVLVLMRSPESLFGAHHSNLCSMAIASKSTRTA